MRKVKLTRVSKLHYFRLFFRGALFLLGIAFYIVQRVKPSLSDELLALYPFGKSLIIIIWSFFSVEMILRFFPSPIESPGCQKQFACNYVKTGNTEIKLHDNNAVLLVGLIWLSFNGILGFLRLSGIFDDGIMILIALFFSVCDVICILFFCPFQTWLLKNKCCAACRIYNWDYAMMFTPLFFVRAWYSWSLLVMSIALLFRWEITVFKHPERFSENTNGYLTCTNCTEKLCTHKKQLKKLWVDLADFSKARIEKLKIESRKDN